MAIPAAILANHHGCRASQDATRAHSMRAAVMQGIRDALKGTTTADPAIFTRLDQLVGSALLSEQEQHIGTLLRGLETAEAEARRATTDSLSARAMLERQQLVFPRLADAASRAEEQETHATALRHELEESERSRAAAEASQAALEKSKLESELTAKRQRLTAVEAEIESARTLYAAAMTAAAKAEGETLSLRQQLHDAQAAREETKSTAAAAAASIAAASAVDAASATAALHALQRALSEAEEAASESQERAEEARLMWEGASTAAARAEGSASAALAQLAEQNESYAVLLARHERMGAKLSELVEIERALGGEGREAAYKSKISRLKREVQTATEALQQAQLAHRVQLEQLAAAAAHAEQEARHQAEQRVAEAREEGARAARASGAAAASVARDALSEALNTGHVEARAREAEAKRAESDFRRLSSEVHHVYACICMYMMGMYIRLPPSLIGGAHAHAHARDAHARAHQVAVSHRRCTACARAAMRTRACLCLCTGAPLASPGRELRELAGRAAHAPCGHRAEVGCQGWRVTGGTRGALQADRAGDKPV